MTGKQTTGIQDRKELDEITTKIDMKFSKCIPKMYKTTTLLFVKLQCAVKCKNHMEYLPKLSRRQQHFSISGVTVRRM